MTHASERLDIMDTITTFRKQKPIQVSKPLAVLLVLLFILALVATGLLVYHCTPREVVIKEKLVLLNDTTRQNVDLKTVGDDKIETAYTQSELFSETTELSIEKVENERELHSLRLPRSIVPFSYEIFLLPFVFEGNFTFSGNVTINVNVTETCSNVTLHADELEINVDSVRVLKVIGEDVVEVPVRDVTNDTERNFLVLHVGDNLNPGDSLKIKIKFVGILNDLLRGFYRSSYTVNKKKRWIAATQFQPTDARKVFPCFDEPALKARFQINIGRSKNMSSISNMPIEKTTPIEDLPNYVWDHYKDSVPMSTYLVAFVVSDFKNNTNGSFSIWTRESAISQTSFSLKLGPSILKYYENFFQIDFPLPKIDMIALPDFSTGAMENWGLITYRESVLLHEQGVSTKTNLQSIAIVVAHELAHQWFGNLVTPTWWTDLWLNEGFASYMEYLGADAVCPELKTLDQFVVQELQNVFALDALKSSHQISIEVNNPDEINYIFDRISYGKGATIIRMMEHFLTTNVFRIGLTNYLNERKYSNAEQDDLWSALTAQAQNDGVFTNNMTVKEIMDTWTLQTGYPVVTVNRNETTLSLKQERFLLGGSSESNTSALWWIPITYVTQKDATVKKLWIKAEPEVEVDVDIPDNQWILMNVNQTGYYRVNYDEANWKLIIKQLTKPGGFRAFDPKNRAQLIDDALNLANAGYLDYTIALDVTKYLIYEREYVPWKAAFTSFDNLYKIFSHSSHFDKFKKYSLYLLDKFYHEIGFKERKDDSTLKIYTRMEVAWRACLLEIKDCINNTLHEFSKWKFEVNSDLNNPISPNLRSIVYCNAIKYGGQDEWEFAWQRYLKTDVGSEKELIMSGLGCSREPWILQRYLEWAITEGSGIRKQDAVRVFSSVGSSYLGQQISYRFLKSNWDDIKKYMRSSLMIFTGIVRESIPSYPTQEEIDDIKRFVRSKSEDLSTASRVIQQLIEQSEANLEWKKRNYDKIVQWLTSFDGSQEGGE